MNVILGALNGMLQYGRGKETGGFGILGIVLAIVAVYQWDRILPFLRKIGIVDFFDKIGLIYQNDPGTTGLAVFLFIAEIFIVLAIVMVAVIVLGLIVAIFCSSKVGTIIIVTLLAPIFLVGMFIYLMIWTLFQALGIKSKKQKMQEAEDKWYMENYGTKSPETIAKEEYRMTAEEVLKRYCEELDYDKAIEYLNKIPMHGDSRFLLGESNTGEFYILLPDPTLKYCFMYPWLPDEYDVISINIQKFIDTYEKFQKADLSREDRKLIIRPNYHQDLVFKNYKIINQKNKEEIIKFYLPDYELKDFKHYLSPIGERKEYTEWAERSQKYYFETKEQLLNDISNAEEKYEFNQLVTYAKALNAPNEEVIKLMRGSAVEVDTN
ncbi:hypothetical protein M3612_19785 [Niallia taxi]|uniref:hypothetical protein n=1 Tax=Niallia taxi TaxID=2499688 RepID=UPI00203D0ACC|nr:hypothetical protein [Niallia taxi]MCM3216730.1 hypothetical protein [Niallia taxi]